MRTVRVVLCLAVLVLLLVLAQRRVDDVPSPGPVTPSVTTPVR